MLLLAGVAGSEGCADSGESRPPLESASGEIVVEHVTRIGDADHPGMLGGFVRLTRLRDGRYALFDMYFGGIVRFFGPDGAYLSTLGQEGYGPGEFQGPWFQFLSPHDTLFVLDIALSRISAFSPGGSTLYDTRTTMAYRPLHVAWLENGWFVANLVTTDADGVPRPLHLVDAADELVQSFGTEFPPDPRLLTWARQIDVDDEGTLWAAPSFEYRVERWGRTGDPEAPFALDTIFEPGTVDFPALPEHTAYPRRPEDGPPDPLVRGVWRQPDGPVFVVVSVAHEDWPARYDPPPGPAGDAYFYEPESSYWKTRIDALDPETGRVLASREVGEMWMMFIGGGEAFSYDVTEAGVPVLDVWRVRYRQ